VTGKASLTDNHYHSNQTLYRIQYEPKPKTHSGLFKASQKMVMLQLKNVLFSVIFVDLEAGLLGRESRLGGLLLADEGGAWGGFGDADSRDSCFL
jgi:hypothetical protein